MEVVRRYPYTRGLLLIDYRKEYDYYDDLIRAVPVTG